MEEEKKGIVTREIDKFRETMKIREAEKEEQDKKRKGSKSPSRRKSKSRERDSESRSRWQINHIQSKIANYVPSPLYQLLPPGTRGGEIEAAARTGRLGALQEGAGWSKMKY